ncbi:DUF4197 domain-containing protein [Paracnuella aquatica]|uniref:DUF4197 domain-containing protein n=1 Tax=Paracnuella aquatica TaxID=2268757 RepID=UPI000DEECB81|nr:DUF4197 domain-containing protein [Paracnuella aquatica]RPD44200.1 DUF4197 domain-containing protein [Paracnuella aquatica]
MKKIILPLLILISMPLVWSCAGLGKGYMLTEGDAAAAIRQMLGLGARQSVSGSFSKEAIMTTLFPEPVRKALNTVQQLGLTPEVDRFTNTLGTAAEKTATASMPVFMNAIDNLKFTDAIRLIKAGGTSGTDYLRSAAGDSLRRAIRPIMLAAIDEYKLNDEWNKITKPVSSLTGNRLNLDLPTIMAGMVSETMFRKMEEKEREVRIQASARSTVLLQKVFSRNWN